MLYIIFDELGTRITRTYSGELTADEVDQFITDNWSPSYTLVGIFDEKGEDQVKYIYPDPDPDQYE